MKDHKTKRREKMSAATFMCKLKLHYGYMYDWMYDHIDLNKTPDNNLYMANQVMLVFILGHNVNAAYSTNEIFDFMGVERRRWNLLFKKSYDWIEDNQELIQLRLL